MVTLTHPGVYVVEEPSGVRPIAGASTSIGMFIGRAQKGPIDQPVRLTNFTEFARVFGDSNTVSDMARYVRMFFVNGGSDTYIMRIADGAQNAEVTLEAEDGNPVVLLRAKAAGASGEQLRVIVSYPTEEPEARFNLEMYRWAPNSAGVMVASETEIFQNLTMDANDPLYAPDYVTQESALIEIEDLGDPVADAQDGLSLSGRVLIVDATLATLQTSLGEIFNDTAGDGGGTHLRISVDSNPYVTVNLDTLPAAIAGSAAANSDALVDEVLDAISDGITQTYNNVAGIPGVAANVTRRNGAEQIGGQPTAFIEIASASGGDIKVRPATAGKDLSVPLMMGPGQGGLEVGAHAHRRPAPNGIQLRVADFARFDAYAFSDKQDLISLDLPGFDATGAAVTRQIDLALAGGVVGTDPVILDTYDPATSANGNSDGIRQRLLQIRDAINADSGANPTLNPWSAAVAGLRLSITSAGAEDLEVPTVEAAPNTLASIHADFAAVNVPRFRVGAGGTAGTQQPTAAPATDGTVPQPADYDRAYSIIDSEVKIFNLMVLPPDNEVAQDMTALYGAASAYCRARRAVLFVDPPGNLTAQQMSTDVNDVRVGIARDHTALFYPRILINEGGRDIAIGPAGAMAGLAARTDATRGVFKGPAGQDLPLFGVTGVQRELSNGEVGMLNPRGVNCITRAPAGVRPWGTRTLDGDDDFASEWKYIPVRRTALYIEQSLYDGLQWVVFEPNGDILWSQIRQNVGAFMNRLFRQGYFKGTTKNEAYFVKCDGETTTQADIDVGVVNLWVGFAPLKPTEFVVIHLQQMAGQQDV